VRDSEDQTKSNRLIFLSIVGIPITIVLAATWLWFFVARGDIDLIGILGTSNHGTLVQPPRHIDDGGLIEAGAIAFTYADQAPQWTFLVPGGSSCDTACEEVLYLTRQIHLAMGKELKRIRRFYVSDTQLSKTGFDLATLSDKRPAPVNFGEYLAEEQSGLKAFTMSSDKRAILFSEYTANPSTWYLVDPAGWIMMSYNSEVSYKDVMSDLKFLLKNSSE
jgi:hypothetical protein